MSAKYHLTEITEALKSEDIGEASTRYVVERLISEKLGSLLKGLLSDPKSDSFQIAKSFLYGNLDAESVVRMSHGENMNKVYDLIQDFKLEMESLPSIKKI